MPLYEYQCFVCNQRFERLQKVSDAIIRDCPSCGGKVRRLLSAPALQFKGSGWYVTDYGKGNGAAAAAGERRTDEATATKDDSTSTKETTSTSTSTSASSGSGTETGSSSAKAS